MIAHAGKLLDRFSKAMFENDRLKGVTFEHHKDGMCFVSLKYYNAPDINRVVIIEGTQEISEQLVGELMEAMIDHFLLNKNHTLCIRL